MGRPAIGLAAGRGDRPLRVHHRAEAARPRRLHQDPERHRRARGPDAGAVDGWRQYRAHHQGGIRRRHVGQQRRASSTSIRKRARSRSAPTPISSSGIRSATKTISAKKQISRIDYNVFEGFRCTGLPRATLSRGEIAWLDGDLRAEAGAGQYVARDPFPAVHVANATWRELTAPRRRRRAPTSRLSSDYQRGSCRTMQNLQIDAAAALGYADGDGEDRRHAEGRHLPPDLDRPRPAGARLVQGAMRGARLHGHGRRGRQHVRAPAGQEPRSGADRHGLASRHPADRRQVRRHARRARRARSHAHAARDRLRDQRADRDRQLDQRGRLALCAGHAGLRRLRRRLHARIRLFAHRSRRQDVRRGTGSASATRARRRPARANSARCSSCTSSKARSSRTKAA